MIKLRVWDKQSDLYPPVGGKLTPVQIFEKWGWTQNPNTVVVISEEGGVFGSIDTLESLVRIYDAIPGANIQATLQFIEEKINIPPSDELQEVSAQERIASALEFQNMMML